VRAPPGRGRRAAGARATRRRRQQRLRPPAAAARWRAQRRLHQRMHVVDDRALDLHRVVLLGLGAADAQMVVGIVDAADEAEAAVDHDKLAVQASQQVGAEVAEQPRLGIEEVHADAGLQQAVDELAGEIRRAVVVQRQLDAQAALRGADQRRTQIAADRIVEQDEGLDQHLVLRGADRLEHARKEFLAVLQQAQPVAFAPALVAHRRISAASAAWSDRCDQGRRCSTSAWQMRRLRR